MSSLQKFHRRTNGGVPPTWPATAIGGGDEAHGYWLGGPTFNALVVAPKSTEVIGYGWGSSGTLRGTTSTTNGLANTNTLFSFGSALASGHPSAYYTKVLTTGGYNTWYLPAKDELNTMYSNKSATPFVTADSFASYYHWSSTEGTDTGAWMQHMGNGGQYGAGVTKGGGGTNTVRAIRRYALPTATIGSGDSTNGYWLGTAGDGISKLVVAPKSTEVQLALGSTGTVRGTTSTTNGLANTNTLYAFGSAAHPAAYYCRTLTTGGYNTWYLPAKDELNTLYSNKSAMPFATANEFAATGGTYHWSSSENNGNYNWARDFANGYGPEKSKSQSHHIRAVRRV